MRKFLYIVLIMVCSLNLWAQADRPVYGCTVWVPMLTAGKPPLIDFANSFRVNSRVRGYDSPAGVGTYCQTKYVATMGANANNPLVGHSMGGVVARDVLVKNPNFGGGLISIGSPLNGAYIANSKSMNRVLP